VKGSEAMTADGVGERETRQIVVDRAQSNLSRARAFVRGRGIEACCGQGTDERKRVTAVVGVGDRMSFACDTSFANVR
jgi:hypothetical protein